MPDLGSILTILGYAVFLGPACLVALLGVTSIVDRRLSERAVARAVSATAIVGCFAIVGVFTLMVLGETRHVVIGLGDWATIDDGDHGHHYHFSVKFVFDRLSVPFVALTFVLCGTIGAFAYRYMHREPGFNRFFSLYSLFLLGMVVAALAGTIETLFLGWELVGLSSALLIGFFHDRPAPVRNALRVWIVYRVSDAALLLAAVVLHHMSGEGDLDRLTGYSALPGASSLDLPSWPSGICELSSTQALVVGGLLVIAAAGKSGLFPFSGWLPRAMEGPTPSSAVFYGAMSVHLGAYLLLRIEPLLEASPVLSTSVVVLGLLTAGLSALFGRAQTDIKSLLSFASLTQVGLIVAEIGMGWRYIPLVHLLGHASLRTLQFVRAPSVLRDHQGFVDAFGGRMPQLGQAKSTFRGWLYRFAMERGYLDAILADYLVRPIVAAFRLLDRVDRKATDRLAGVATPPKALVTPTEMATERPVEQLS